MADALVSTVLDELKTLVIDKIKEEVRLLRGVEEEVEKLTSTLQTIKDGLADADQRQMVEPKVSDWLWKLKDISYDIDDVLDEWITSVKRNANVEGEGSVPSNPVKERKKVCFADLCCCSCFRPNIHIVQRHEMAVRIENLNKRLDAITLERNKFQFKASESNQQFAPRQEETGFAIDEREVKGRDQEKVAIVNKLLSGSSEAPNPQIISIVGMGGLGKTTLAKLVYNEKTVEAYFDKRIWVWVSRSFDATNIAKAIDESLEKKSTNVTQLSAVMELVQQSINGKRFLLVLDDVWEEQAEQWEKLKDVLACGLPGSKILVTTRNDDVAVTMGCDMSDTSHTETLSEEECWSIFSQITFSGTADAQPEYLKDIGRKIVKKCQGLPLAAKTIGSLLRSDVSKEKWESVLYSKLWDQQDAKRKLLAPIWLSYSELLPQCFSYCAVFPKGQRIQKHKLIEAWMAQGYLRESLGRSMEVVGEEYFQKLAGRSLFQDFEKDEDVGSIIACKMHDMVHDVAQFTSKNECFIIGMEGSEDPKQDSFYSQLRHTTMMLIDGTLHHGYLSCLTKLHSVYFQSKNSSSIGSAQLVVLFSKWSCLRSLNLSNCGIAKLPIEIGEMIHLRWLDFSFNYDLEELPESISELLNLQSLDVTECPGSMTLPRGIGKLADLRHFHNLLFPCHGRPLPKSIGLLTGLKTLEWLHVGDDTIEEATLGDLRNLNQLKGKLRIKWSKRISEVEEGKQARLNRKDISDLTLCFPAGEEERRIHHDADLIDALEPSPNLRSLSIWGHQGKSVFPKWLLSLTSLRKLELVGCLNC